MDGSEAHNPQTYLPPGRRPLHAKCNFASKCVPKFNLGTRIKRGSNSKHVDDRYRAFHLRRLGEPAQYSGDATGPLRLVHG
jgi:hypothetical protein